MAIHYSRNETLTQTYSGLKLILGNQRHKKGKIQNRQNHSSIFSSILKKKPQLLNLTCYSPTAERTRSRWFDVRRTVQHP